ncbi:MAG: site-specific DNA-methyltransferase [Nitrospinae bacterium]|nr:site-specific DNA-methyltransferase [Nitrospinota bacterium]
MLPYYEDEAVTLYLGDCRDILPTLGLQVDVVIADPPYGQTSLAWDRFIDGLPTVLLPTLGPAASMWWFGSLRVFMERAGAFDGWKLAQDIIWRKHNGSSFHADRFRRVHEQVAHFYPENVPWAEIYVAPQYTMDATKRTVRRKRRPPHMGHIERSAYESQDGGPRLMLSVLEVPSTHGYAVHPTQKPVEFITHLLNYSCPPGGLVLDPTAGSGSTLLAAKDSGRRAVGIEIDERYCEAAAKRMALMVMAS